MQITIPFKTPSINHLYWHRGNIKIMTSEAKKFRQEIKDLICIYPKDEYKFFDNSRLKVEVEILENWYCQNGEIKKKDLANREKFLIDSIFEALNIDDKHIFELTFKKIQDEYTEKAVVNIYPL